MANEIKFRSEMPRIIDINAGDAFLISRDDGSAGYTLLSDAIDLRGAPFTYNDFTPEQIAELQQPSVQTIEAAAAATDAAREATSTATAATKDAATATIAATEATAAALAAAAAIDAKVVGKVDVNAPPLAPAQAIASIYVRDTAGGVEPITLRGCRDDRIWRGRHF